jgi:hypothetical protein
MYKLMERLLVATADSPKHGQPGQASGEDGVKTPWAWAVNTPAGKREKIRNTWRREGGKGLTLNTRQPVQENDLTKRPVHQHGWDGTDG